MAVTVVGSIAYDQVKTPFGERERMLGGAATHFALAASFFDQVRVVGPVGDDFADSDMEILATRGNAGVVHGLFFGPGDEAGGPFEAERLVFYELDENGRFRSDGSAQFRKPRFAVWIGYDF